MKWSPAAVGTICGVISAASYTAASFCLRYVALECDPLWVCCVRAVPAALVSLLLVAWGTWRGSSGLPPRRFLGPLILAALFSQFGGNTAYQFALGGVGVAMTAPLTYGTLIVGGALLGWLALKETVTRGSLIGMILMLVAIVLLGLGADDAAGSLGHKSGVDSSSSVTEAVAMGAACMAGFAYAVCNVIIRRMVTQHATLAGTLLIFSLTGVVVLGLASVWRLGIPTLARTDSSNLYYMLAAGVFNAVAFYAISKGLQLMTVARVNALNATSLAMMALGGILFFNEAASLGLVSGVALMVAGIFLVHRGA
jgi:DME family drug/metabolite transporter